MRVAAHRPGLRVTSQSVSGLGWKEFCDQFCLGCHIEGSGGIALYKWLKCGIRGDTFVLSVIPGLRRACDNTFFPNWGSSLLSKVHLSHWQGVWEALWRRWYTAQTALHTEGQAVGRALASAVSFIWVRYLSFCPQRVKCNLDYATAIFTWTLPYKIIIISDLAYQNSFSIDHKLLIFFNHSYLF